MVDRNIYFFNDIIVLLGSDSMEIIVGKLAGFCGGVINSVTKTEKLLEEYKELYCLGELVHNKQVVDKLKNKGLIVVDDLGEVPDNSMVIIRAHGVANNIYEEAYKRNIRLFDLTCPNVLKIHEQAKELVEKDNYVVLIAQKDHPEAVGTISFCGDNCDILESHDDISLIVKKINDSEKSKVSVISQTTFSVAKFDQFTKKLIELLGDKYDVEILNTICNATDLRQKETKELSSLVDAMIIIGGKNSSNTKKLYELAKENCENTYIIETVLDIVDDFSIFNKVGIMAGASTPKESIEGVVDYLKSI